MAPERVKQDDLRKVLASGRSTVDVSALPQFQIKTQNLDRGGTCDKN